MTQNTTKNDKWEHCDTKHNAMKINLTRKKFTPYPVPPAYAPVSVWIFNRPKIPIGSKTVGTVEHSV